MSFKYDKSVDPRNYKDYDGIREAFTEMLVRCQSRGSSATGIVLARYDYQKKKARIHMLKSPVRAQEFVNSKEYKDLLLKIDRDAYFIIGHTRAVTQGSAHDNRNNHPHIAGTGKSSVIGVHNGAINNDRQFWSIVKDKGLSPIGSCDSEAIFAMIEHHRREGKGMNEAVAATMQDMKGWYALAMMDAREPSKMVLVRDGGTPIEMAWVPSMKLTLISSEKDFINRAVAKSKTPSMQIDWMDVPSYTVHTLDSQTEINKFTVSRYDVKAKAYEHTEADKKLLEITSGRAEPKDDNIVVGSN
jgi:glucosamine 6-phosphate synthetase-like amidotransferase/phosphosugar isomerase protein